MNVVGLESFVDENTQPLRCSFIPPKATVKVIGRDKRKAVASSIFFQKKRSSRSRRPSAITTVSQGEPTTVIITGIPSNSLNHSVGITETPANRVEFKVVNLLDIHDDVIVAIARIISIPRSGQLHNR